MDPLEHFKNYGLQSERDGSSNRCLEFPERFYVPGTWRLDYGTGGDEGSLRSPASMLFGPTTTGLGKRA